MAILVKIKNASTHFLSWGKTEQALIECFL